MKGDEVIVTTEAGGQVRDTFIRAETAGAEVEWDKNREWVTVSELNAVGKVKRTARFATAHVVLVVENKARPE